MKEIDGGFQGLRLCPLVAEVDDGLDADLSLIQREAFRESRHQLPRVCPAALAVGRGAEQRKSEAMSVPEAGYAEPVQRQERAAVSPVAGLQGKKANQSEPQSEIQQESLHS